MGDSKTFGIPEAKGLTLRVGESGLRHIRNTQLKLNIRERFRSKMLTLSKI